VEEAHAYGDRLRQALPAGTSPVVTAYLTDTSDPDQIERGFREGTWFAAKWYPAKATTNSHAGVTHPDRILGVLERMAQIGMPLLVHGEVTTPSVDIFDREAVFLDTVLSQVLDRCPGLRCVVEHVTTQNAVDFVAAYGPEVAATITPHHLWWSRNAIFDGGLRPHAYCLPVLKREKHRRALRDAAVSGSSKFFAGTDSAPHLVENKEKDCGCAGVFNALTAIAAYAQVFEEEGRLEYLERFLSRHGAAFYRVPVNAGKLELRHEPWVPPEVIWIGGSQVRVFLGGTSLNWRVTSVAA
jgi:dihydroorotase